MPFLPDPFFKRRRWQRVPLESSVTVNAIHGAAAEVTAPGIDISQGGMSMGLAQPFAGEGRVRVHCCLPGSNYALETIAKIRYCDEQRCGVQFETLSIRDQRELRKLCSAFMQPASDPS